MSNKKELVDDIAVPLTRTQQKLFLQRDFTLSDEPKYDVKVFDKISRLYTNISWSSKPVEESWQRIMKSISDIDGTITTDPIVDASTGKVANDFLKYLSKK